MPRHLDSLDTARVWSEFSGAQMLLTFFFRERPWLESLVALSSPVTNFSVLFSKTYFSAP